MLLHMTLGVFLLRHGQEIVPPPFYKSFAIIAFKQSLNASTLCSNPASVSSALQMNSAVDPILEEYNNSWWLTPENLGDTLSEEDLRIAWDKDRKRFPRQLQLPKLLLTATSTNINLMSKQELLEACSSLRVFQGQLEEEKKRTLEGMRQIWMELERIDFQLKSTNNPDLRRPIYELKAPPHQEKPF